MLYLSRFFDDPLPCPDAARYDHDGMAVWLVDGQPVLGLYTRGQVLPLYDLTPSQLEVLAREIICWRGDLTTAPERSARHPYYGGKHNLLLYRLRVGRSQPHEATMIKVPKGKSFKATLKSLDACVAARKWAGRKSLKTVWRKCRRPEWLLWLLCNLEYVPKELARALRAYAQDVLPFVLPMEQRPVQTLAVVDLWLKGEASRDEVYAAGSQCQSAALFGSLKVWPDGRQSYDGPAYDACKAVACIAWAISVRDPVTRAQNSSAAMTYLVDAVGGRGAGKALAKQYADRIRRDFPYASVRKAFDKYVDQNVCERPARPVEGAIADAVENDKA